MEKKIMDSSHVSSLEQRVDVVGVGGHEVGEGRGLASLLGRALAVVSEPAFEDCQRVRRVVSDFRGDRTGLVLDSRDQSHPQGRLGVDRPSREGKLEGVTLAEDAGQPDGPAPGAEQAEADAGFAVGRLGGSNADVTGQREFEAAAPCGAVDPRNDDCGRILDRSGDPLSQPRELGRAVPIPIEGGNLVEIGTGGKGRSAPAQVDYGFVGIGDRCFEGLEPVDGECVAGLGAVDRHGTNPSVGVDVDHASSRSGVSKGLWLPRRNPPLMDKADSCRRAAAEAVADVEPPQLHEYLGSVLDRASMIPAALTLESAAAMATEGHGFDEQHDHGLADGTTPDRDHSSSGDHDVVTHAAGVQLIYEGLRLTRALAHDEPWTASDADAGDGDLAILAADILVARGFYLLARTEAAGTAVRTVQSFGRDQTRRADLLTDDDPDPTGAIDDDPTAIDANLERDVLELAVRTGAVAVGETPSPRLLAVAEDLADAAGTSFPAVEDCLTDLGPSVSDRSLEDHATDRATSATDP